MVPLLLTLACIDTGLKPVDSEPSGDADSSAPDPDSGHTSPPDSADSGGDTSGTCTLAAAGASVASQAPTCTALGPIDWDLAVELDHWNGSEADATWWGYIGSPVVAPAAAAGPTLLLFQSWVDPGPGSVLAVDPSTGAVAFELEDVGNDVDHLAVAMDARSDRAGEARFAVPTAGQGLTCATASGILGRYGYDLEGMPALHDITHDGVPEIVEDYMVLDATCNPSFTVAEEEYSSIAGLIDETGAFAHLFASSTGLHPLDRGPSRPWSWTEPPFGFNYRFMPIADNGQPRVVVQDVTQLALAGLDGEVLWSRPCQEEACQNPSAVGDLDGDGRPEIVTNEGQNVSAFDLNGDRLWSVEIASRTGPSGGLALADLDADGRYEVVHWCETGLHILDGGTGAVLAERTDMSTIALYSDPVIADVDGDGSAEIVVTGDWADEAGEDPDTTNDHLFVLGAATGRWARTRPVWNQTPYDITTIRDDGTIVRFPRPSWQTYNAFRAQPAHDGDHPDLTLAVTDACADSCGPGGTVRIAVQASNLGSKAAPAGATIRLYTWSEATGVREVGTAVLPDEIPSGWSPEGVVFEVPWEDWGEGRYAQIDGADGEECDLVNDRIDVLTDPCG